MINTFLSKDDEALKLEFEQFAKDKLSQVASELISVGTGPVAILKQLAPAGYLGLNVPAQYGGKDSPLLHLVLLSEALANYEIAVVLYLAYHAATIELLKAYGSDEQKNTYLPKLAKGTIIGTLAYLESAKENTSKDNDLQATALKQDISPLNLLRTKIVTENNDLILSGQKELVLLTGPASPAAKDSTEPNPPNLIFVFTDSSFIILDNLYTSNIKIEKRKMALGLTSAYFANLSFENQPINKSVFLGNPPKSEQPQLLAEELTFARNILKILIAAGALGTSERVLKETTNHAKLSERGGSPLAESQAIQWKLADAAADTSAARLLTYRAAWSKEEDINNFSRYVTMAKIQATRAARHHAGQGLQIILPFLQDQDTDFPLTGFYMDSKMLEVFDATNEEEKVILSKLLGI